MTINDSDTARELPQLNPYFSQVAGSSVQYPKGYMPTMPYVQIKRLEAFYPELDASHVDEIVESLGSIRTGEELYQVVPKLALVARLFGIDDPYGEGYGESVASVLMIHLANTFTHIVNAPNSCHRDPDKRFRSDARRFRKYTRLMPETRERLERLEVSTPGDYNVISMQGGKSYPMVSIDGARARIAMARQWDLPVWVVGHHLLTHPDRMGRDEEGCNILCTGDKHGTAKKGRSIVLMCRQSCVWIRDQRNDQSYIPSQEGAASGTRIP